MKTVKLATDHNLCSSCGVCKSICPKGSITYHRSNGVYLPTIDNITCISCGLCAEVCPGLKHKYEPYQTASETITGSVIKCHNAWSLDAGLRHVSASGGVVSTITKKLLESGKYDVVFTLDTYDYRDQLQVKPYSAVEYLQDWNQSSTPKSRYLPVSHENTIQYLKEHRDARTIVIGTPCGLRGVQATMDKLRIEKDQHLFIGLFCDKVFNYNVIQYFNDIYSPDIPIEALHFKNKESGGWPGDMKFFPKNEEPFYRPLSDRAKAKSYFMPERCLYCVDKLNVCADISVGDNYTGQNESELGSNSVIIRTQKGIAAWKTAENCLEFRRIDISAIQMAQAIDRRLENLYFGDLHSVEYSHADLNPGIPREKSADEYCSAWKQALRKLQAGAVYCSDPIILKKQIKCDNKKPNPLIRFIKRGVRWIKQHIIKL
ncbi:MAG: Coenzyme F420 hydrogenase/dehydrogenase, beta subunit C-terminal domain [Clostridia bacterium]|nr:Coenzyme F420 hydrogenase/dehydrogenase, beta subunit C-terminal domain [Clostridia bacterium]